MTATDIENSVYTITVTNGTDQSDVVLATVNGAIKEINIIRRLTKGNVSTYDIIVTHDDVGTTALEWTSRSLTVTSGTTITDDVFGTVAGVVQAAKSFAIETSVGVTKYDIIAVHLNA